MGGHGEAAPDLVAMDRPRPFREGARIGPHLPQLRERPRQVDGGRTRGQQRRGGLLEVLAGRSCERVAHRGGDPDRGCATHGERPDRVGDLPDRTALEPRRLLGKASLVQEHDTVVLEPDHVLGPQISLCHRP
jgi:hypothetical protein